jgi:hypothetical protein
MRAIWLKTKARRKRAIRGETESNSDLKDLLAAESRSLITSSWVTPGSTSVAQVEA